MTTNLCDIVLPVFNSLHLVKEAIDSILKYTHQDTYQLYIINDASDQKTSEYLYKQCQQYQHFHLYNNPKNIGFLKSCNFGLQQGNSEFTLILNSDVIVTPRWLEKLLECAYSDTQIASVNPLTNSAEQINLSMPAGSNFLQINDYLNQQNPAQYPDVVTGVGFCLLLRRSALHKVGLFDEVYGKGYCEESDLCMRLTTHGFRTVVAGNVYVYHKGRGSFIDQAERYQHNRAIFDLRWKQEYKNQFKRFQKDNPLQLIRSEIAMPCQQWDPKPVVWQTGRKMLHSWHQREFLRLGLSSLQGIYQCIRARRDKFDPQHLKKLNYNSSLRVTYVLNHLVIAGGVLSVIQIVNELILSGINARIVALFEDPAIYSWTKLYTKPIIFSNSKEMIENFPETDIVVATLWKTTYWVDELIKQNKAQHSIYFVQDYEPWFFSEQDELHRQQAQHSYSLIKHKIVKSNWLQNKLADDGFHSTKIRLGMDLGIFYPHDITNKTPATIMAMARPKTAYRGFDTTIEVLTQLKKERPEINIILFGDRSLQKQKIPFAFQDEGIVSKQNYLAQLYSQSDVFLDASDFQGFGRCGLEAMACGAACVLTEEGGVTEYAVNNKNALLVRPKQVDEIVLAIKKLLDNKNLKHKLIENGFITAKKYCHKDEAKQTMNFFQQLYT